MSVSVHVPFVPNVVVEHVSSFVVCCVETPILLMGDVAYDTRFSECNEVQSRDIIIRRPVTSSFKSMYFQIFFGKNYYRKSIELQP